MFIAKHKASSHIQLSEVLKESIFSHMELAHHRLIEKRKHVRFSGNNFVNDWI